MSAANSSLIHVARHERWAELEMRRADKRNALSQDLVDEMVAAFEDLHSDGCEVVVLSAAGTVFCAGGDVHEVTTGERPSDQFLRYLRETPLFVIAKIQAPAYGAGVSLVASCPMAIAGPRASFVLPEAKTGNFPVPAAYLEVFIPRRRVIELALNVGVLDPQEAQRYGLVSAVDESDVDAAVADAVDCALARPLVTAQAREYWQAQFRSDGFVARDGWLRDLVTRQPASNGTRQ